MGAGCFAWRLPLLGLPLRAAAGVCMGAAAAAAAAAGFWLWAAAPCAHGLCLSCCSRPWRCPGLYCCLPPLVLPCSDMVRRVQEEHGKLDILVNK